MPIYEYECMHCLQTREIFKSMVHIERPEVCPGCYMRMTRLISPVGGDGPFMAYESDNLSPWSDRPITVTSRSHKRNLEKAANVISALDFSKSRGGHY